MRKLTARKVIILSGCVLLLLLVSLYTLSCYHGTKRFYSHRTEIKLHMIYNGILVYMYKHGEYPPDLKALAKESITEQYLYDIKQENAFLGIFVHYDNNYKKMPFLYDNLLKLNKRNEAQIIVAEPLAVDNMRYVIYTRNINDFAKQIDEFKKNPELFLPFYFKTRDDSVKRIHESEFQEQAKKQGWSF